MVGYVLFSISLLFFIPIVILAYLEVRKLKMTVTFLDSENRELHENIKQQFVAEGYKRLGINPRPSEPKQIEKL